MARKMGMNPERVVAQAGMLSSGRDRLEHAVQSVEQLVAASLNPLSYAVQPGGLIIAPWSIAGTNVALMQVRAAMNDLNAFIGRAMGEAAQQRAASSAASLHATPTPRKPLSREDALKQLLDGELSQAEIARIWKESGLTPGDLEHLSPQQLAQLSMMDGLPAVARDKASRMLMDYALEHPDEAYKMLGFEDSDTSLKLFKQQIAALDDAVDEAEDRSKALKGTPAVQLVGLGNHDGALVAAISLGDLDTADRIAVNVPGMNSDLDGIANGSAAGAKVYEKAMESNLNSSYAIVAWYGYNSPGLAEVRSMDRADAGAKQLVGFLDGIQDSREGLGNSIENFSVLAHSYGSTTAAEALKFEDLRARIDDFVMYGSAGLENGTTVEQLKADSVHATAAAGDNLRWAGYTGGNRTDPHDITGVKTFSAEDVKDFERVTAHDMFTEDDGASFWNWGGKRGYLSEGTNSLYEIGKIVAGN